MSSTFSFKFVTYISNSLSVLPRPKGGLHSISRAPFKAEKENTGCHRKKDIQLHSESLGIAIRGLGLKCVQAHSANSLSILFGG